MSDDAGTNTWIGALRRGDTQAARQLWDHYFDDLVRLARGRLPGRFRRAADEEDVALSALRTFLRRAGKGEFPQAGSGDIWPLLVRITARKALKLMEREGRLKRGGGRLSSEADLAADDDERALEQLIGSEPTPDFVVQVADTYDYLLGLLPDEPLRQVARLTVEGYTLQEIAGRLEFSVATAGRKLKRVRDTWANEE